MPSPSFEDALKAPDTDTSRKQLYLLSCANHPIDSFLPATASKYLQAFCDKDLPVPRRRWIGLCLKRMLNSPKIARHLAARPRELARLGNILLSNVEAEQTKVIAATAIRQGVESGLAFATFWPSEKVPNSTSQVFPTAPKPTWFHDLQTFLDTLDKLALAKGQTDPVILYPVALAGLDGFKWGNPDNVAALVIVENGLLTAIIPDPALEHMQFLDVPLDRIEHVALEEATLHHSQSRRADVHNPWNVVLQLQPNGGPCTYDVDGTERTGDILTLFFAHKKDAEECELGIKDFIRFLPPRSTAQSSAENIDNSSNEEQSNDPPTATTRNPDMDKTRLGPSQSKKTPGTLPKISKAKKPKSVTASQKNTTSRGKGNDYDEFEFPDDTPTRQGTSRANKKRAGKAKTNLPRSKSVQQRQMAATDDEEYDDESAVSSVPHSSKNSIPATRLQGKGKTVASHHPTSVPRSSALPKIAKDRSSKASKDDSQSNVYSIPKEDESERRIRARRKSLKKVNYNEDDEDDSASDYASSGAQEARSTKRKSSPSNRGCSKRARKASPPKSSTDKKPRGPPAVISAASAQKSVIPGEKSLEPQSLSAQTKSASPPKLEKQVLLEIKDLDRLDQESEELNHSAHLETSRSNSEEDEQTLSPENGVFSDGLGVAQQPAALGDFSGNGSSRKRPAGSSPPLTPCAKKAKTTANDRFDGGGSMRPPATVAPARILSDPSSPCGERQRASASRSKGQFMRPVDAFCGRGKVGTPSIASARRYQNHAEDLLGMRHTPLHHNVQRTNSGELANAELLSSNSKPLPASPHAESRAISGHADQSQVDAEQQVGENETAKSDPFKIRTNPNMLTTFTKRLTEEPQGSGHSQDAFFSHIEAMPSSPPGASPMDRIGYETMTPPPKPSVNGRSKVPFPEMIPKAQTPQPSQLQQEQRRAKVPTTTATPIQKSNFKPAPQMMDNAQPSMSCQEQQYLALEDDETLVADEGDQFVASKKTPMRIPSSPPISGSHTSTSAISAPDSVPSTPVSAVAEESEWESSLQAHQRPVHDELLRISKRVLRNIVDNETAVNDIAEMYEQDAHHTLDMYHERHASEMEKLASDVENKSKSVKAALESYSKRLTKQRKRFENDTTNTGTNEVKGKGKSSLEP